MTNIKNQSASIGAVAEKSLFRNIIGLGLLVSLFYFANKSFTGVIDDVVESKYEWVAERFKLSIGHIHREWMIKSKPKALSLTYHISAEETAQITVQLNKLGWPLNVSKDDRTLNCLNLWMLFAHEEGHKKSILDLTSHLEIETTDLGCEFYYQNRGLESLIFGYNLYNGEVSTSKLG